jgi:hypothetical protein
VTRKSLLLFAAPVIWGRSFLCIRVAVEHIPPAVVFGRTVTGAAFLVPLAARRRAFRGLRPVIVPIAVVTLFADDPSGAVPVQAPAVSG